MKFLKKYIWSIIAGVLLGLLLGGGLGYYLFYYNKSQPIPQTSVTAVDLTVDEKKFMIDIPSLGIEAPIITGIDPADEIEYNGALKDGVVLMPGKGMPGILGNTVVYGHSSASEASPYQKVFATLDDLGNGDEIKIYKEGVKYIYKVTEKKIVKPTDFSILAQTKDITLTLMTCWPVGTDEQRLIVIAKKGP